MVEERQSTKRMRMDLANTLRPDWDLYDPAFMSYRVHLVHQLVASITRQINMVEQRQSTQKMRRDLANTLIQELDLYDAAFTRYGLH